LLHAVADVFTHQLIPLHPQVADPPHEPAIFETDVPVVQAKREVLSHIPAIATGVVALLTLVVFSAKAIRGAEVGSVLYSSP
jgi:hypothetical protein